MRAALSGKLVAWAILIPSSLYFLCGFRWKLYINAINHQKFKVCRDSVICMLWHKIFSVRNDREVLKRFLIWETWAQHRNGIHEMWVICEITVNCGTNIRYLIKQASYVTQRHGLKVNEWLNHCIPHVSRSKPRATNVFLANFQLGGRFYEKHWNSL